MAHVNPNKMNLYQTTKADLVSLLKQTAQGFVGLIVMLLLTGGKPSGFVMATSVGLGIGFVAWSEVRRLEEARSEDVETSSGSMAEEILTPEEIDFSSINIDALLPQSIHPNK